MRLRAVIASLVSTSVVVSAQELTYEVVRGELGVHHLDEEGNREDVRFLDFEGTCVFDLVQSDLATSIRIRDIDFVTTNGEFEISGTGNYIVRARSWELGTRPAGELIEFSLDINEHRGLYFGMPPIILIIFRSFPRFDVVVSQCSDSYAGETTFRLSVVAVPRAEDAILLFRRGDVNADDRRDLGDALSLLNHLFAAGPPLSCLDSGDTNDDGALDVADVTFLVHYLFLGGDRPPVPTFLCGLDETEDPLDCQGHRACTP